MTIVRLPIGNRVLAGMSPRHWRQVCRTCALEVRGDTQNAANLAMAAHLRETGHTHSAWGAYPTARRDRNR